MKLQEQSRLLEEERRELAGRLADGVRGGGEQVPPLRKESPLEWSGSAVPTVSLQQKPTPVSLLPLWMTVRSVVQLNIL